MPMRRPLVLLPIVLVAALPGCGGGDPDLVVYSGRSEPLIKPFLEEFAEEEGLDVQVRFADTADLVGTLLEEGDNTPADVFLSQDAGALGAVEEEGLLAPLPQTVLDAVKPRFRSDDGRWVGLTGRARVIAYDSRELKPADLPDSILDFTKPEWKGRIGFPPTNASFQAFVSAMRLELGDERTRQFLEGLKANEPKTYENNIQTEEAIARGEVDVGFVNHYYAYELRAEQPSFPVRNHFLRKGDPGSLVNAAGAGVLASSDAKPDAERFVRYLLSRPGQIYVADKLYEYPVAAGVSPPDGLPPLDDLQGPSIALEDLGGELRSTLQLLDQVGLTS